MVNRTRLSARCRSEPLVLPDSCTISASCTGLRLDSIYIGRQSPSPHFRATCLPGRCPPTRHSGASRPPSATTPPCVLARPGPPQACPRRSGPLAENTPARAAACGRSDFRCSLLVLPLPLATQRPRRAPHEDLARSEVRPGHSSSGRRCRTRRTADMKPTAFRLDTSSASRDSSIRAPLEIREDMLALEKETKGLLAEIVGTPTATERRE